MSSPPKSTKYERILANLPGAHPTKYDVKKRGADLPLVLRLEYCTICSASCRFKLVERCLACAQLRNFAGRYYPPHETAKGDLAVFDLTNMYFEYFIRSPFLLGSEIVVICRLQAICFQQSTYDTYG
jgi:hypothetical protein